MEEAARKVGVSGATCWCEVGRCLKDKEASQTDSERSASTPLASGDG